MIPRALRDETDAQYWKMVFHAFSGDEHSAVRQAIAGNAETPEVALWLLEEDDDLVCGQLVANPATPFELRKLFIDSDDLAGSWQIYLERTPDADSWLLESLTRNPELWDCIVTHPAVTLEAIGEVIGWSRDASLAKLAISNPNFGIDGYWFLYERDEYSVLAGAPNCPTEILEAIADDVERREGILDMWFTGEMELMLKNPNAPHAVLEAALEDVDKATRHAREILENTGASPELKAKARAILGPDAPPETQVVGDE